MILEEVMQFGKVGVSLHGDGVLEHQTRDGRLSAGQHQIAQPQDPDESPDSVDDVAVLHVEIDVVFGVLLEITKDVCDDKALVEREILLDHDAARGVFAVRQELPGLDLLIRR